MLFHSVAAEPIRHNRALRERLMQGSVLSAGLVLSSASGYAQTYSATGSTAITQTISAPSTGVSASAVDGATTLTINGAVSATSGNAVNAVATGTGAVNIAGSGTVSAAGGYGATGAYGTIGLRLTTGVGINVLSSSGDVTVGGSGSVNAAMGVAVVASSASAASSVTINRSGAISSAAANAIGAYVITNGRGAVSIDNMGPITLTGNGAAGIIVVSDASFAGGGTLNIGGSAGLSSAINASLGKGVVANYAGSISVKTASTGQISGDDGVALLSTSANGSVTAVFDGNVTATGGTGVSVDTNNGAIQIGGSGNIQGAAAGIFASSVGGGITISGSGATSGGMTAIVDASGATSDIVISRSGAASSISATNNGTGAVSVAGIGNVTSGGVTASAKGGALLVGAPGNALTGSITGGTGVSATNTGSGTIGINQGATSTITGTSAEAIRTSAVNGATTVSVAGVVTGKTKGVSATSTGTGAINVTQAATSTISATGGAAVSTSAVSGATTLTINGTVSTTSGNAVNAVAGTGAVNISGSGTVSAAGAFGKTGTSGTLGWRPTTGVGINVLTSSGDVTVGGSGSVNAAMGIVVVASSASAASNVTINRSGAISSDLIRAAGVAILTNGRGAVSIDNIGPITLTGGLATGISVGVDTSGAAGAGVSAGGGTLNIGGSAGLNSAINVSLGTGVAAVYAGSISVKTASTGLISVGSYGLLLQSTSANGSVTAVLDGNVTGATGLSVTTAGGAIQIGGSGKIQGTTAISASSATGGITISGSGATSGGMMAYVSGSGATGDIVVSRSGDASSISATNNGSGAVSVAGIGNVTSGGVTAGAKGGALSVGATGNALTGSITGGTGVSATNTGSGAIAINQGATSTITGTSAEAIKTSAVDGATAVSVAGGVTGKTKGVSAAASGSGTIAIDAASTATVTGAAAVDTSAKDGATTVNVAGQVGSTDTGTGLRASSTGTGGVDITIASGGVLRGSDYGIDVSVKDGQAHITNSGAILGSVRGVTTGSGAVNFTNFSTMSLGSGISYTGLTSFVNNGSVQVGAGASLLAGSFQNRSGAVLSGVGTLGAVTAEAGSFIRPGDRTLSAVNGVPAVGTLKTGALTLAAGSTVEIRADASGVSDKIIASGAASLGDATLRILATPNEQFKWSPGKTYTMLEATSVSGKFALQTDLVFLTPTATYRDTGVDVTLARNSVTFDSVATNMTQKTVGAAIQNVQETATGKGKDLVVALANLTETQAPDALEKISAKGTVVGAAAPTMMTTTFVNTVMTQATGAVPAMRDGAPSGAAFSGGDMPAMGFAGDSPVQSAAAEPFKQVKANVVTPVKTWRLWTSVFGSTSQLFARSADNLQGAMYHQWGGAVGFESMLADNFAGGVALSGMSGPFSVGKGALKGESSGGQIALYGALDVGRNYLMASASYGRFRTDATRLVEIPGTPAERLSNRTPSGVAGMQLEAGRRFDLDVVEATPFVGFQPSLTHASASTEKSSVANSLYGLTYATSDTLSLPVLAGLQLKRGFAMEQGWSGSLEARGALVHEFRPSRTSHAAFTVLPGSDFVSIGPSAALNTARLSTAIMATDNRGLTLSARISGDFSTSMRSMRIEGGVKYDW